MRQDSFNSSEGGVYAEPFGVTADGREVTLFRIPNSTEDYIEVLNYGCTVKSLFLHDWEGRSYQNQLCGFDTLREYEVSFSAIGAFLDMPGCGVPEGLFSHRVWDVSEVGANYVFFSCRVEAGEDGMESGLTVGAKIQWVNLNRLVVDLYATPDRAMPLNFGLNLLFRADEAMVGGSSLRTFVPMQATRSNHQFTAPIVSVADTPYADQMFVPVRATTRELFLGKAGETHPVAELVIGENGVCVSVYTTANACEAMGQSDGAVGLRALSAFVGELPVSTETDETWSSRVIYGFDRIGSNVSQGSAEPDLFSALIL